MKNLIPLLATVLMVACASAPKPEQQQARDTLRSKYRLNFAGDFEAAIKTGDVETVRLFMLTRDGYPYSHYEGKGTVLSGESKNTIVRDSNALEWAMRYDRPAVLSLLLKHPATSPDAKRAAWDLSTVNDFVLQENQRVCRSEIYQSLLANGGPPENPGRVVWAMVYTGCPAGPLGSFLKEYPAAANNQEAFQVLKDDLKIESQAASSGNGTLHEGFSERFSSLISTLLSATKAECDRNSLDSCKMNDEYQKLRTALLDANANDRQHREENAASDAKAEQSAAERAKYESSGQADFDRACRALNVIAFDKKAIQNQREIAAEAGVVNKVELYQSGQRIQASKMYLEQLKASYKRKSGQSFNIGKCPPR